LVLVLCVATISWISSSGIEAGVAVAKDSTTEGLLEDIQHHYDQQSPQGLAQAVVLMKEASALTPRSSSLMLRFGEALERTPRYRADALGFLDRAYALDRDAMPWRLKCKLVFLRRQMGHIATSIELGVSTVAGFKEAYASVARPPQAMQLLYVKLLSRLSRDLIAVQNVTGANEYIQHALGLTGKQHIFVLLNAVALDMQGRQEEASIAFEQAVQLASQEKSKAPTVMAEAPDRLMGIGASGNFARNVLSKRPLPLPIHDKAPPAWIDDTATQAIVDTTGYLATSPSSAVSCQLDRRHNIDVAEFVVEYALPGKPVVLTGVLDNWWVQ
jgi:hypothetical protein